MHAPTVVTCQSQAGRHSLKHTLLVCLTLHGAVFYKMTIMLILDVNHKKFTVLMNPERQLDFFLQSEQSPPAGL